MITVITHIFDEGLMLSIQKMVIFHRFFGSTKSGSPHQGGHELGSSLLFGYRLGFSGTPSNLLPQARFFDAAMYLSHGGCSAPKKRPHPIECGAPVFEKAQLGPTYNSNVTNWFMIRLNNYSFHGIYKPT